MPGRAASSSAVAVLRSTRWASGAGEWALAAGLAGALAGALTAAEAEWTGTASMPAATRRDSRASARRDRIIVFEPPWSILSLQYACRTAGGSRPRQVV